MNSLLFWYENIVSMKINNLIFINSGENKENILNVELGRRGFLWDV